MSLYQKYRPQTLDQVRGNEEVVLVLTNLLKKKKEFPHTVLFHGETGCGKTTLARIIAKELGCKERDLAEINSADFRGIDTVRDIIKNSQYLPIEGEKRAWIIDEVHKMTNDAQNALLKLLEDSLPHVYFLLCTTEPQKLLPTIRGRCSEFQVKPLSNMQMHRLLRSVVRSEKETLADEVYEQIVQDSLGHPRNALQILEQVLSVPEEHRIQTAQKAAAQQSQIIELCRALINKSGWKEVRTIIEGLKDQEPENIRRIVLGYCQAILLKGENDRAAMIIEAFWDPTYNVGFPYITYACYSITKN